MSSCSWAYKNEITKKYHDGEWGVPVRDDRVMFEYLSLECLQCGLSWDLIMKKRGIFRKCFDNFNYETAAKFKDFDIQRIFNTDGMIKSLKKIKAVINNAECFLKIRAEFGSFCNYIWAYSDNKTIVYTEGYEKDNMPAFSALSKRISKDLKKRGFKYTGESVMYSFMQACGIVNGHAQDCPQFEKINKRYPVIKLNIEDEEIKR